MKSQVEDVLKQEELKAPMQKREQMLGITISANYWVAHHMWKTRKKIYLSYLTAYL